MEGIWVKIRNNDWRPRKDIKNPAWFKCSNRLLEDEDFYGFELTEILVWVHVLSLASQKDEFTLFINFESAERKARLPKALVLSAIEKLKAKQIEVLPEPVHGAYAIRTDDVRDPGPGEEGEEGSGGDAATIPIDRSGKFKSYKDLLASLPLLTKDTWLARYSPDELDAAVLDAFAYYSTEPKSRAWPATTWASKIGAQLKFNREREQKKAAGDHAPGPSDHFCGIAEDK